MRRFFLWTGGVLSAALLLAVVAASWLLTTASGTRWLLAQVSPLLPDALRIGEVYGSAVRGLDVRGLSWSDGTVQADVAQIELEVELLALLKREVRITRLSARNVDVAVSDSPAEKPDTRPLAIDLPITLRVENASIDDAHVIANGKELAIDRIGFAGQLSGSALLIDHLDLESALGEVSLAGDAVLANDYAVNATTAWDLRLPERPALSGLLQVKGDSSSYAIRHNLDAPYAVETRGTIELLGQAVNLDLESRWQQLRIDTGDARAVELADGLLRVFGTPDKLDFDGTTKLSSADIPVVQLQTKGVFGDQRIEIASLSASNAWGKVLAGGTLNLSDELHWSFDVDVAELDTSLADPRMKGALDISASTSGRLAENGPEVAMAMQRLSGRINDYPVDGSGQFSYSEARLTFDDAVVSIGDNRLELAGSYGPGLAVDATLRFPDLRQLGLDIAGALNGNLRFTEESATFSASADVAGANLEWGDYRVETLLLDFDMPATGQGSVALQLDSAEQGSLVAGIDGRFVGEQWSGTLRNLTVRREPVGEWTLQEVADFSVSRDRFNLQKTCLGTATIAGEVCIALDYDSVKALNFDATVEGLPLAALPRTLPAGATVLGEIGAQARGSFADGRLNSSAGVQVDGLGLLTTFEGDEVAARFDTASANTTIVDNRLRGGFEFRLANGTDFATGSIELGDLFDQRSALLGQASLALEDLALFSFFFPDVANPAGRIIGQLDIGGSLAVPEISGELELRGGSVEIRPAGIAVTDIGLLVRQNKAGELVTEGSARSGEGYLQISGETVFDTETGIRSEIRLNGEDFRLLRLPDWQLTASPAIAVLFDERETRVSGKLGIPAADITVQTVPESTEKPSPDVVVHRGDTSAAPSQRLLRVDVTTVLGEAVAFSGFGLSTRLEGSVRISGDSRSPYTSQGRVVLRDGRYQAYGQNLEIETGELVFNGPLSSPALNVRATRTASDKTVAGIHLTGTPNALRSEVYSEPALGDAESLSYLLTGRALNNADSAEGDMLNQAAFALGLTQAGQVASRIRTELGLDTLGFQGGGDDRQLVAGKQLNNRLFIEYAYGVVDSLGTLLLRYQLSRRLMVESRSGAVRIVDVVYSVKKP